MRRRFTSYEKIEIEPLQVVKRDQRREPYEREKLMGGFGSPAASDRSPRRSIERVADSIEAEMQEIGRTRDFVAASWETW